MKIELETLSDALFFIREAERLNRQSEEQTKRETKPFTPSKPKPKIARFLPNQSDKKCHPSDKKCQHYSLFNGLACGKPVEK